MRRTVVAGRTEAPLLFYGTNIPAANNLWAEAMLWVRHSLDLSSTTASLNLRHASILVLDSTIPAILVRNDVVQNHHDVSCYVVGDLNI